MNIKNTCGPKVCVSVRACGCARLRACVGARACLCVQVNQTDKAPLNGRS